MKTTNLFLKMLLFVLAVSLWSSCSKSDDFEGPKEEPTPTTPTTPPDGNKEDPFMVVCEHVCDVANKVAQYHKASKSIAEMAQHIDEIKQIEYVEDVYTTNTTMFVNIKDYGVISYSYFPKEEPLAAKTMNKLIQKKMPIATSVNEDSHPLLELDNAVISVWFKNDWKINCADKLGKALNSCNITTEPKDPSINFFQNDIFDYDVVYINTHGMWDPEQKLHWLVTTDEPTKEEVDINESNLDKDKLYKFRNIDRDQLTILYVHDANNQSVPYFGVSEKFINLSSSKRFKKSGKAICFISACQTLMGGSAITETDQNFRDFSLAKVFEGKGVGAYFGYDESQGYGSIAAMFLFAKLASGMSLERAHETIPNSLLHIEDEGDIKINGKTVHKKWIADLLSYYSDKNSSINKSCITQPVLGELENNSTDSELNYILKATSPLFFDDMTDEIYTINGERVYFETSQFLCNYQISEKEDYSILTTPQEHYYGGYENNVVTFMQSLSSSDLKSGTTYYYRGFFYDGKEYYYTEPGQFTTRTFSSDGSTSVPDVPGSNF